MTDETVSSSESQPPSIINVTDVEEELKECEFFTVVLRNEGDDGLTVNVQPGPGIENVLPENFVQFVCVQVGQFIKKSMNQLKVKDEK